MDACKITNSYKWPTLSFMMNCIVELGGLHLASTYQHFYVNLRQYALLIRQASQISSDSNSIYTWQFIWFAKLHAKLLISYNDEQSLKPLAYPFVQIIIAALRIKPSSKYFPFRCQVLTIMNDVSKETGIYIPITCYVLEVYFI
jgi:nucleolar complex protein 2